MVFITEIKSVYSAVRTGSQIKRSVLRLKGLIIKTYLKILLNCEVFFFGVIDVVVIDSVNRTTNASTIDECERVKKEMVVI